MKIAFAFLVKDRLPHTALWTEYWRLLPAEPVVLIHAHTGRCLAPPHGAVIVPTVPTTWGQTMQAHLQLQRAALEHGADRYVLLSESCVPCLPPRLLVERLADDVSWFKCNWRNYTAANHEALTARFGVTNKVAAQNKRIIHEPYLSHVAWAEQWHHLTRRHLEILVGDTASHTAFADCKVGDNEHWPLTTLKFHGEIRACRFDPPPIYTYWPAGQPHPRSFRTLDTAWLKKIAADGAPFLRKVPRGVNLRPLYNIIHERY